MLVQDSRGGWSEDRGADPAAPGVHHDHPFRIDGDARYQPLDIAGRGGMGEVWVARDQRLGREVALKRLLTPGEDDRGARRLAREAWITARLTHPSIVPVYDAGQSEDGRLYYTMRLIHGRSLREVLDEDARAGQPRAERRALLRHFLAACEAIAYAHSHGIVHRDLKPANILIGAFGETQVVDWGLAGFASRETARVFHDELPLSAEVSPQGAQGTPAYMSPEQARGAPLDPRDDVWALGAILHEIALGERLLPGASAQEALERLRAGAVDRDRLRRGRDRLRGRRGPRDELRAIIEQAIAADPAGRYRDAGDMAADLARYLDGRRVQAHDYTTLQLLARVIVELRVPLIAAASALLATAVALLLGFQRVRSERTRAVAAEAAARVAQRASEEAASFALAGHAVAQLQRGAVAEAELLAAHALLRGESADARGVAAAARAHPRPERAEAIALPGCARVVPGTFGLALCLEDAALSLWQLTPARRRWQRPLQVRAAQLLVSPSGEERVAAMVGASEILILDGRGEIEQRHQIQISSGHLTQGVDAGDGDHLLLSEGRIITVLSLRRRRVIHAGRGCAPHTAVALAGGAGRMIVLCGDGARLVFDGTRFTPAPGPPWDAARDATSAALWRDGRTLVVGTVRGELLTGDLGSGVAGPARRVLEGPVRQIEFLGDSGRQVIVLGDSGGAQVWDLSIGAALLRLPAALSAGLRIDPRGVITGGRRAARFVLGGAARPRGHALPAGLAAIAVSPDGRLLAAGRGDGHVTVLWRHNGQVAADLVLGSGVVKTVDFAPDGRRLAASVSAPQDGLHVFDTSSWTQVTLGAGSGGARRLAYDPGGALVAARYGPPLELWSADGARRQIPTPEIIDLSAPPRREPLSLLSVDGDLLRLRAGAVERVGRAPGATLIAAWPDDDRVAAGRPTGIAVHAPGQPPRWIENPEAGLTDLIVSPDGGSLIGGRSDGVIAVWRVADQRLVANLRGHRLRVAHLCFAPDGLLYSAGWDGQVLGWDLSVLAAPPRALVDEAERAYGADLGLVLR